MLLVMRVLSILPLNTKVRAPRLPSSGVARSLKMLANRASVSRFAFVPTRGFGSLISRFIARGAHIVSLHLLSGV